MPLVPETSQFIGHTALTLTINYQSFAIPGFEPRMGEFLWNWRKGVVSGESSVRGYYDTDTSLAAKYRTMRAEFALSDGEASAALKQIQELDAIKEPSHRWTGTPESRKIPGESNCVE